MPAVFINYRTGDGDVSAALIERELSRRFGGGQVFRAPKSIKPTEDFTRALRNNLRRSEIVLVVIGPSWSANPRLRDERDWVRQELLLAIEHDIRVLPVLIGRKTERLSRVELPTELKPLADFEYVRLDSRTDGPDLTRIGDFVAELVPSLRDADQADGPDPEPGATRNRAANARGSVVQARDIGGDAGTVFKESHGPVHTGRGDINHHAPRLSGPGAAYVAGDNHGGISHTFGASQAEDTSGE